MASPRIKNNAQEVTLVFARIVAFVSIVLVIGLAGWVTAAMAGAPWGFAGAIGGAAAGVAGFFLLVCGSFYEVTTFTCPECGQTDRVLKHIGTYNCFKCGKLYYIYDNEADKVTLQQHIQQSVQ